MRPRVVALGDSISCGQGIGITVDAEQTWVGLLAQAMDADLDLLARPGARTREVLEHQVPHAITQRATVATVLTGLNDVVDGAFDARGVHQDVLDVARALRAARIPVLLVRLHDPTVVLPLPAWLRRRAHARVGAVNAAVDAARPCAIDVLDLADVPALGRRSAWAEDRVHPSITGHLAIAAAAAQTLRHRGFASPGTIEIPAPSFATRRPAEIRWLVRHGLPYLARKAVVLNARHWSG